MNDLELRLAEYAMGTLAAVEHEQVEDELRASSETRALLVEIEAALAEIEPEVAPVEPSARLREAVLSHGDPERRYEAFAPRLARFLDLPHGRALELIGLLHDPSDAAWQPTPVPGTRAAHFDGGPRVAEADCGFVSVDPGSHFPAHRHIGDEWALILSGRGSDSSGALWCAGDLVHQPQASEHHFRVLGDQPLVFALVLFGGLEPV